MSSSALSSVLATTLRTHPLEVDLVYVPVPVWVQYITVTGIPFNARTGNVPCRYWYILVQYQYWHGTLPVVALNGAHTDISIFALLSSTNICARCIIGTGIKWCQYL